MSQILNIEIKAKCENAQFLHDKLQELKADYKGNDEQKDIYFNCEKGRLKLRSGNIENSLIFYSRNNQKGPKESNIALSKLHLGDDVEQVLNSAYGVKVEVNKKRYIYFIDNVRFHIDEVAGLGIFIEIEAVSKRGVTKKELLSQCEYYIDQLKIKRANLIDYSYSDLILNPSLLGKGKPSEKNERPIVIDLFSGAGGLSCGLEMAGFECILGVDIDESALKTFKKNHKSAEVFCGSIEDVSYKYLDDILKGRKLNLLAGGPPCQGFSTVGKGDPNDKKNQLFQHYCRILDYLKPDYLLFENVTGILAKKNKRVLDEIIERFRELGYAVKLQVLESQKYGVPQKRKRIILLGTRLNRRLSFPKYTHDAQVGNSLIPAKTAGDALKEIESYQDTLYNHNLNVGRVLTDLLRERLECIPEGRGIRYKKDEDELLPAHLKLGVDWNNIREGRLRELHYYRLDRKKPAPTINTRNSQYFHPTEIRYFTSREIASFQSFPLGFEFCGPRSSQLKQIGNAVPPLMAKALGQAILDSYNSESLPHDREDDLEKDFKSVKYAFNYDNCEGIRRRFL